MNLILGELATTANPCNLGIANWAHAMDQEKPKADGKFRQAQAISRMPPEIYIDAVLGVHPLG
jgi:hypothetical protein